MSVFLVTVTPGMDREDVDVFDDGRVAIDVLVADRIAVMHDGRIVEELDTNREDVKGWTSSAGCTANASSESGPPEPPAPSRLVPSLCDHDRLPPTSYTPVPVPSPTGTLGASPGSRPIRPDRNRLIGGQ